jgi:hypothetical protein
VNYFHNSGSYTYIGVTPDLNDSIMIGDDREELRTSSLEFTMPTAKNIIVIINDLDNIRFPIISANEDFYDEDDSNPTLIISLTVDIQYKHKDIRLNTIDPILRYYKKLYPVDKLDAWATIRGELTYVGRLNRISYDTDTKKYRTYFNNNMVFVFDNYPFSVESTIQVQGVGHVTPVDMFWIIESGHLNLVFIKHLVVLNSAFSSILFDSMEDFLLVFNDNSGNLEHKYNDRFDILMLEFNLPHLNRSIILDLNSRNIPIENLLRSVNSSNLEITPIPFRTEFLNTQLENVTVTIFMLDREDEDAANIEQLDESHYFIQTNCKLQFDCKVSTINQVIYNT